MEKPVSPWITVWSWKNTIIRLIKPCLISVDNSSHFDVIQADSRWWSFCATELTKKLINTRLSKGGDWDSCVKSCSKNMRFDTGPHSIHSRLCDILNFAVNASWYIPFILWSVKSSIPRFQKQPSVSSWNQPKRSCPRRGITWTLQYRSLSQFQCNYTGSEIWVSFRPHFDCSFNTMVNVRNLNCSIKKVYFIKYEAYLGSLFVKLLRIQKMQKNVFWWVEYLVNWKSKRHVIEELVPLLILFQKVFPFWSDRSGMFIQC